jgi:hypothetical protein
MEEKSIMTVYEMHNRVEKGKAETWGENWNVERDMICCTTLDSVIVESWFFVRRTLIFGTVEY